MDELDDIVIDGIAYRAPREGQMTQRFYAAEVREGSDGLSRTWVINTESIDTYRTVIDPEGGDLSRYNRNPVVLIGHDHTLVAANSRVRIDGERLIATVDESSWDLDHDVIATWKRKVDKGLVRGASIGFLPTVVERVTDGEGRVTHWVIRKWVLLEWSICAVPSNPDALVEGRSSDAVAAVIREFTTALDDLRGQIASLSTPASTQAEDARSASDSAPPIERAAASPAAGDDPAPSSERAPDDAPPAQRTDAGPTAPALIDPETALRMLATLKAEHERALGIA